MSDIRFHESEDRTDDQMLTTLCRQHPILSASGEALCDELAGRFPAVLLRPGHELATAGEQVVTVDFLLGGTVRVFQRAIDDSELLSRLVDGPAVFGDAELLQQVPHVRSVEVLEPSWFIRVPAEVYQELLEEQPALMRAELMHLSALSCLDAFNERNVLGSLEQRIANVLLAFAQRYGRQREDGSVLIDYPVSLKLLARSTGAVWRSVGYVLSGLRKRGLLGKRGDQIVIEQPDELTRMAEVIGGGLNYQIGSHVGPEAAPPRRPPSAEVEIVQGPALFKGQQTWIEDEIVIGREPPVDVLVVDVDASPRHCRIFRGPTKGRYWIQDLDSAKGTKVNGEKVRRARLHEGDRITIGSTELQFRTTDGHPPSLEGDKPFFQNSPSPLN